MLALGAGIVGSVLSLVGPPWTLAGAAGEGASPLATPLSHAAANQPGDVAAMISEAPRGVAGRIAASHPVPHPRPRPRASFRPAPSVAATATPAVTAPVAPAIPTTTTPAPTTTRLPSVASTSAPTTSPVTSTPAIPLPGTGGASAAERFGWGDPVRAEEFEGGLGPGWGLYDGPGHVGNGRRSPGAVSTANGIMTITGTPDGTTDGMAWSPGQKYGRWEARVSAPVSDPSYHVVLLLWPDAENWPVGGEVDFMENSDPTRQSTQMFLHYGSDNRQLSDRVAADATQWHDWAVEWTPDHVVAYLDGVEWFRTTDRSTLPPGSMHLCIQLDWFPRGGTVKTSTMSVDWVRQYAL